MSEPTNAPTPETPNWDERYRTGDLPWDSNIPSRELIRVLDEEGIPPGRVLELGCGTGTNSAYLAQRGFAVTAVDISPRAIELARERARREGVSVEFIIADVTTLEAPPVPYDFIFDRGCYHCVRRTDLPAFQEMLRRVAAPGSRYLVLAGNANEVTDAPGPPRVHEHELRADFEGIFEVLWIREFRFQDPGGTDGPLGWAAFMNRL